MSWPAAARNRVLPMIGFFGGGLGLLQFAVDGGEFGGAFGDACSSVSLACFSARSAATLLGDVGICRHEAACRASGLERISMIRCLASIVSAKASSMVRKLRIERLLLLRRHIAASDEDGHDSLQRKADLADGLGQVEQRPEARVPDGQPVGLVEDGDALVHLAERRLQAGRDCIAALPKPRRAAGGFAATCRPSSGTAVKGPAAPRPNRWPCRAIVRLPHEGHVGRFARDRASARGSRS